MIKLLDKWKKFVKYVYKVKKKICEKCYCKLPLDCFNVNKKTIDGYSNVCKACKKENDKFNKVVAESNIVLECESCKKRKLGTDFYRINDKPYIKACKECVKVITSHKMNKHNFKTCSYCNKNKNASIYYFDINIRNKDYLQGICRECKKRKWYKIISFFKLINH